LSGPETPATRDRRLDSVSLEVVVHGPVGSLQEAAGLRGVAPSAVIKTLVVRRGEDDYVFVLVPGDRVIDWPKLRALLGVRRLAMPDADEAFEATGYRRGTITPLGSEGGWPVVADERVSRGRVSVGGGAPGVSLAMEGQDLVRLLGATVADVTRPREDS
jgi:Cys-tRNA(Pro) deacylase